MFIDHDRMIIEQVMESNYDVTIAAIKANNEKQRSCSVRVFLCFIINIVQLRSFLVAVVIVFTVCQIPQAISLTVQSFFPTLSRTSKVLIYNNFANCLVAVNASINFLLYCCFSDRFRLTFSSSFSFISKYCVQYIGPSWKRNKGKNKASPSMDTMSFSMSGRSSSVSVYGRPSNKRLLNMKNDPRPQPTKKIRCDRMLNQSGKWSNRDGQLYSGNIDFKQTIVSHLTEKVNHSISQTNFNITHRSNFAERFSFCSESNCTHDCHLEKFIVSQSTSIFLAQFDSYRHTGRTLIEW